MKVVNMVEATLEGTNLLVLLAYAFQMIYLLWLAAKLDSIEKRLDKLLKK